MNGDSPETDSEEKKKKKRGLLAWLKRQLGIGSRGAAGGAGVNSSAVNAGRALGAAKFGASSGLGGFLSGNIGLVATAAMMAVAGGVYLGNNGSVPGVSTGAFSRAPDDYASSVRGRQTASRGSSLEMLKDANKPALDAEGYDSEGYDKDGYNRDGYDRDGYDRDGYNKDGYNKDGVSKYDENGYDKDGYDKDGYNKDGYDRNGVSKYDENGYDKNGYNKDGYDKDGYDKDGYNKDGYNRDGYNRDGYNKDGVQGPGQGSMGRELGPRLASSMGSPNSSLGGGSGSSSSQGAGGAKTGAGFSPGAAKVNPRKGLLAMRPSARNILPKNSKGGKGVAGKGALNQAKGMRSIQQSYTGAEDAGKRATQAAAFGEGDRKGGVTGGVTNPPGGSNPTGYPNPTGTNTGGDDTTGGGDSSPDDDSSAADDDSSAADDGTIPPYVPPAIADTDTPWEGMVKKALAAIMLSAALALAASVLIKIVIPPWVHILGMAMAVAAAGLASYAIYLGFQIVAAGQGVIGAFYMMGGALALAGALAAIPAIPIPIAPALLIAAGLAMAFTGSMLEQKMGETSGNAEALTPENEREYQGLLNSQRVSEAKAKAAEAAAAAARAETRALAAEAKARVAPKAEKAAAEAEAKKERARATLAAQAAADAAKAAAAVSRAATAADAAAKARAEAKAAADAAAKAACKRQGRKDC